MGYERVPFACDAGLGQGLKGYIKPAHVTMPLEKTGWTFVLRDRVLEDARSVW